MFDEWWGAALHAGLPALEYVNAHTLTCGCLFLIGWQEPRVRHPVDGLVDLLEVHAYAHAAGVKDAPPEQAWRIVTQEEAEAIVDAKRDHEWWGGHVVGPGHQPEPRACRTHAHLVYGPDAYATVRADPMNGPTDGGT